MVQKIRNLQGHRRHHNLDYGLNLVRIIFVK